MLNSEEFGELVRARRTIRGFQKDKDVPEEYVQKILDIARWAPSGGNGQPWEFIVIRDPEMRQRISDLYIKQLQDKVEMDRAVRGTSRVTGGGFRNAPVFIVVIGDLRVNQAYPIRTREEKSFQHFVSGLASAVLLIHLAATSLGLASQWVSDASSPYMSTMLKVWLGVPEPLRIYELIPIGYPTSRPSPPSRRPLDEIVHSERYEPSKRRDDEDFKRFVASATLQGGFGKSGARTEREGARSD